MSNGPAELLEITFLRCKLVHGVNCWHLMVVAVQAKLAQIDLFPDCGSGGGGKEARVLRYKEKRRSRLFSKKIRYQVRKVNAEQVSRLNLQLSRKFPRVFVRLFA